MLTETQKQELIVAYKANGYNEINAINEANNNSTNEARYKEYITNKKEFTISYIGYSQNDKQWKKQKLGNSSLTIGNYGCYCTCIGMRVGKNSLDTNNSLKKYGGFNKSLIDSNKAAKTLGLTFKKIDCSNSDAPINDIVNLLKKNIGVVVEVDSNPNPTKKSQHFVYVVGFKTVNNKIQLMIHDPWDGIKRNISEKYYWVNKDGTKLYGAEKCILSVRYFY
jgi:hypothetical protein